MPGIDPTELLVAPTGKLLIAPEGTAAPTDNTTAWAAAWVDVGYLSEQAVKMAANSNQIEIKAWQSDYAVWSNVIVGRTVNFQLMQWSIANLQFAFGGGSTTTGTGVFTYKAPAKANFGVQALGLETVDGPNVTRIVWHRVKITDLGDVEFKGDTAAMLDVTVQLLANGTSEPFLIILPGTGALLTAEEAQAQAEAGPVPAAA